MSRVDVLQARMIGVMPLPEPPVGPRTASIRIRAYVIAGPITYHVGEITNSMPSLEEQVGNAAQAMRQGAYLERVDADPTNWAKGTEATWRFSATDDTQDGALKLWLDWWGNTLQVPRIKDEADSNYRLRMLDDAVAPTTTNYGMAATIDRHWNLDGTQVVEAFDFYTIYRLDSPGKRLDGTLGATGIRLDNAGPTDQLWNCFVVLLPDAPFPDTTVEVVALSNKLKAAGERCVAALIYTP
jgi:hypothetical protein